MEIHYPRLNHDILMSLTLYYRLFAMEFVINRKLIYTKNITIIINKLSCVLYSRATAW